MTHPLLAIIGFGAAAAAVRASPEPRWTSAARDAFERRLPELLDGARFLAAAAPRLPNTSLAILPRLDSADWLRRLSSAGLHASAGSACEAGAREPSHVLRAMQIPAADAHRAVRFSFGRAHDASDGKLAAERVASILGATP